MVCYAGELCVPQTYLDKGVPNQSGAEVIAIIGCQFGPGLTPSILNPRECVGMRRGLQIPQLSARAGRQRRAGYPASTVEARRVWARVGQVLRGENTAPRVAAKLYKAVIQDVLLYRSKTLNLTKLSLARLEEFHVHAVYKMAREHRPRKGASGTWVYPKTKGALEECGMRILAEYIQVRHQMIATYILTRPNLTACMEGKRRQGLMPRQWWWEQPMCLDATDDAIGLEGSDGHLVASTTGYA